LLLYVGALPAQYLDQGNFMIGSTVGFSTAKSNVSLNSRDLEEEGEGNSGIQFNIAPKIGYFVIDNLALGLGMDYTFSRVKEPNQDETTDADLLFGPFGRFFLPLDDDISLFVEGTFGYGNSSDDLQVGTARQRINTNIVALGVGPGLSVYSNSGFGIEAVLKYNFARSKFDTEVNGLKTVTTTKTNAFDFSIGVVYYFEGFRRAGG
jgi:hypothetical protein